MTKPVYIWGFPGVGKSSLTSDTLSITDADCTRFQFLVPDKPESELHIRAGREGIIRQIDYPNNYFHYLKNQTADLVLINCHPSLLHGFDQERLLLVYPEKQLKDTYLRRYLERGDHPSFLREMNENFDSMLDYLSQLPFRAYTIKDPETTLQTLLDGGIIMTQFITKKDLTALLEESISLGVYTPDNAHAGKTPAELSQMLFDGELTLDLDQLRDALNTKRAELEKERVLNERRGGLSHDQLRDKLTQALVNSSFFIEHGQVSPYQYGFEVMYPNDRFAYTNRWECYCPFEEVPERLACMIEQGRQDEEVFSSRTVQPVDITAILRTIDEKEQSKLTTFTPMEKTKLEPRGRYTGHVATLKDVHAGIALDGIALGKFHGDYSSITTSSQNSLMESLVFLKGFCLDCLIPTPERRFFALDGKTQAFIVDHLKAHGTDISTPEKLQKWIRDNPDKCALPENRQRKPAFTHQVHKAKARSSTPHKGIQEIDDDLSR